MPLIGIPIERLQKLVGIKMERDELLTNLERMGCDVGHEGFQEVRRSRCNSCDYIIEIGKNEEELEKCPSCGSGREQFISLEKIEVLRMELLPVRPDMFDVGGLARALRGYLGLEKGLVEYDIASSGFNVKVSGELNTKNCFRPYIACAVIRDLTLDTETVKVLMKMQENLHWAIGRDRKKSAIGVYDLTTLSPDFEYTAVNRTRIRYRPLGGLENSIDGRGTPEEILSFHPKGVTYKDILSNFLLVPIIIDSKGQVLSMPPIINSDETRITDKTRNLFVDVTGTDEKAVRDTLAVFVSSMRELGGKIESVKILYSNRSIDTPELSPKEIEIRPEYVKKITGLNLSQKEIVEFLERMRHDASPETSSGSDGKVKVKVPAYRTDIMHEVDLIEDIAIAYGYHRIEPGLSFTYTIGEELEIEKKCSIARNTLCGLGFLEIMSLMLTNKKEHYERFRMQIPSSHFVKIQNPESEEQEILRTHLTEGILSTFQVNRTKKTPQRIFEIGDVCIISEESETGVKDIRKIACGVMDAKASYAEIKSVLETLAREMGLQLSFKPSERPAFLLGRVATLCCAEKEIGIIGEIHPEVLEKFDLFLPVVFFEIKI